MLAHSLWSLSLLVGDHAHLTEVIIGAALRVHSVLGPGLLESAYRACLTHELRIANVSVREEVPVSVRYGGVDLPIGYRIDLLVESAVVVELKAVERLHPVHRAQLVSYLRLSGLSTGLLINFHEVRLADGIKRVVNTL